MQVMRVAPGCAPPVEKTSKLERKRSDMGTEPIEERERDGTSKSSRGILKEIDTINKRKKKIIGCSKNSLAATPLHYGK